MDRDNRSLLAAFSTVLPLDGPATTPRGSPAVEEGAEPYGEAEVPAKQDDDEVITGAGGAYL